MNARAATPYRSTPKSNALIELKRLLRASSLITVAEVQGNAAGFGLGLAILCDFTVVSSAAALSFPEMRKGLPPAAIMAYLGRYTLPKAVFPARAVRRRDQARCRAAARPDHPGLRAREPAGRSRHARGPHRQSRRDRARQCKQFFQRAQENTIEQNFRGAVEALTVSSLRLMKNG
ncbi:MAG: enoyl-CoA hydratase-related protein [Pararobbsia sp.]